MDISLSAKTLDILRSEYKLSPRQLEIAKLIVEGQMANSKIAAVLGTTTGTVRQHIHLLYLKMGVDCKGSLLLKLLNVELRDL